MTIKDIKERDCLLLECISGSRAYGLNTETSDTDIKGIYYMPKELFYAGAYIPQISNETGDEVYFELGRFVELLIKNNPSMLELLATPEEYILYSHPLMQRLSVEQFLSRLCKDTFAGFAMTQVKKARGLKKKIVNPMDAQRKSVLDFCFIIEGNASFPLTQWLSQKRYEQQHCGLCSIPHAKGLFALYYDSEDVLGYKGIIRCADANEVSLSAIPKDILPETYLFFNSDAYSIYCREFREYWEWVARRNESRFTLNSTHGGNYDAKNMMHTIRLLQVAREIGLTSKLNVRRENRSELLSVKRGEYTYEHLLEMAELLVRDIPDIYAKCTLPLAPDAVSAQQLLVSMREELYHS